jgi:hypothetical protein
LLVCKAVSQRYNPPKELLPLFEEFRWMINEAIRIGIEKRLTSLKNLSAECYPRFQNEFYSSYRVEAINKALTILRNFRRKQIQVGRPYVWKGFITVSNKRAFKIENGFLSIPISSKNWVQIPLGKHTLEVLKDKQLVALRLFREKFHVVYSKEIHTRNPVGFIGIDRNLRNISIASSDGTTKAFDISQAVEKKLRYAEVKSHFTRNTNAVHQWDWKSNEFEILGFH